MIRASIQELIRFAINKGGILVSETYKNCQEPLIWKCSKGHNWSATWNNIKYRKSWCPKCAKQVRGNRKYTTADLQAFAIQKQGKLLSIRYLGQNRKHIWSCVYNHKWLAKWKDIKYDSTWCPTCSSFKKELECKAIFENIFNKLFIKQKIIPTKNGYKLELDGYNKELKIAFEYNGYQHYTYPNYWHKTQERFIKLQQNDIIKKQWCIDNNIILIIIPYTENNLKQYIEKELQNVLCNN